MVEFKEVDLANIFGDKGIIKIGSDFVPEGRVLDVKAKEVMSKQLRMIIDRMGDLSADAQRLNASVTNTKQMRDDQWIYLMVSPNHESGQICGLLKAGYKDLYLYNEFGDLKLMKKTPALLDFYVHESCQRRGLGLGLYKNMLVSENWRPEKLAIDRPSTQMMSFMKKQFGLQHTLPQANHFAIFTGFFEHEQGPGAWDHSQKMRNSLNSLNGSGGAGGPGSSVERK